MSDSASTRDGNAEPRFPWQVGLAGFAWAALALTVLGMALGGGGSRAEADASSIDRIQGTLGKSAAATGDSGGANPAILVLIGLAVLLMTGLLMLGQGWARWALSLLGVAAVIYLASTAHWQAIIAMAALVVGSLPLLSRAATRYLAGAR